MKGNSIWRTIMTILVTSIVTVIITMLILYGKTNNASSEGESVIGSALKSDSLSTKLMLIKNQIKKEFLGNVDENNLQEYTIKGYVAGLNDIYSQYYTANEMKEFNEDTVGSYVGVGIYMTKDTKNNKILVYETMKGSPAEAAGILAGDAIVGVDGTECNGDDYDTISSKIKGVSGTNVNITIERDGKKIEYNITRKQIEVQKVSSEILEDNIGYIYISSFDGETVAKQFKTEYENLKSKGIKSLVVDVRNNGGGIVDEAIEIADMFTEKGQTLLIEKDKNDNEEIEKAKTDKEINMNVVLLVNGYSASASEILAGIMKDDVANATIIGTKTYGKGVIQSVYQLSDGSGLKLTTNEYFTPNHDKINKIGIEPDIIVDDYTFDGTLNKEKDTQLKKAIEVLKEK